MATNFYLFPKPDKHGEQPIRVSISIKGERLLSTAGISIKPSQWDADSQRAKDRTTTAKKLTDKDINALLNRIDSEFYTFEKNAAKRPTKSELAEKLDSIKGTTRRRTHAGEESEGEKVRSLMSVFDEFISTEGRDAQWTEGTLQCWRAFRHHLEDAGFKSFDDFTEAGMRKFVTFLRTEKGMGEPTTRKHYSNLRWFLNWSVRHGYCQTSQISPYLPKFKVLDKPVIFLDRAELKALEAYKIPANGTQVELRDISGNTYTKIVEDAGALNKTKDLFIFCAYTSLRYSDMAKLKRADIYGDAVHVYTKKTNDSLAIELNSHSRAILDKYAGVDFPNGLALPVISNQKMNDYIKDLCELCGINTPISRVYYKNGERCTETLPKWAMMGTHAGRRTFICYALSIGIPPQVIMKWTGHSTYKAMKPYIDIAETTKADAMRLFNE